MGTSRPSEVVYRGEVLIADWDLDQAAALERRLEEFIDLAEGEELHVSMPEGDRLEVRKLREDPL